MDKLDPFDSQAFHELCMDYRGSQSSDGPQKAYERIQAYCRRQMNISYNDGWIDANAALR